jgi:hypothetical protein
MKIIPKFLCGNFIIGPNGFVKHDGYSPIQNMFSIHWFPGYGVTTTRVVNGKQTSKVRFNRFARFLLRWS